MCLHWLLPGVWFLRRRWVSRNAETGYHWLRLVSRLAESSLPLVQGREFGLVPSLSSLPLLLLLPLVLGQLLHVMALAPST
jgi:hypothetical protein